MTIKIDKGTIEADYFLDLPKTTQLLYFYFLFDTDKDGYIRHPKTITEANGFGVVDFDILRDKGFVAWDNTMMKYRITAWKRK